MNDFSLINSIIDRDEFSSIVSLIDKNSLFAFALTCKGSYNAVHELKEPIKTTFASLVSSNLLIKWAVSYGCPPPSQYAFAWGVEAAKGGHLDVLRWMRYNYAMEINAYTAEAAALGGHIDVLCYLRMNGCNMDADTCAKAALTGHLHVMQWARANGCPWDKYTCASAAEGGHLSVLQWARANCCPWDVTTCMEAARGGHLTVLKWAVENGCKFNNEICQIAAIMGGRFEILKWIHEKEYPWYDYEEDYTYMTVCNVAASRGFNS